MADLRGGIRRRVRRARGGAALLACAAVAGCASQAGEGGSGPFDVLRGLGADGSASAEASAASDAQAAGGDATAESEKGGDGAAMASGAAETAAGEPGQKTTKAQASPTNRDGQMHEADSDAAAELTPRYCYRTLGTVDCYLEPRPERRRQRVGSFHETAE